MKRAVILLSIALSACAPFSEGSGRVGPPDGGHSANDRRGASTTSVTDQQQLLLAETAAELKLTPRQLVLWERYQQRVGALMADQLRPDPAPNRRLSAPQQIDSRVETVRHRLAAIEEVQDAASAVYESLDVEQQKVCRPAPGGDGAATLFRSDFLLHGAVRWRSTERRAWRLAAAPLTPSTEQLTAAGVACRSMPG